MRHSLSAFLLLVFVCASENTYAQEESMPIHFNINRIVLKTQNQYTLYIPTFEFHMFLQREFTVLQSSVTADYDYRRQDMGFGMSHQLYKYVVNPGVHIQDNLFFREVFTDSTGVWRRKQSINPFLSHEINDHQTIVMEFKIEREWSPMRRMGTEIVSNRDRSIKLYYIYNNNVENIWDRDILYLSLERSYKFFKGQYNYFLAEIMAKRSFELNIHTKLNSIIAYRGNITPEVSPLYFLGGYNNLIGFENDEFWGRQVFYLRNNIEYSPFPLYETSVFGSEFRRFSLLLRLDVGRVNGITRMLDLRTQNTKPKIGIGVGIGFNTDLPYMPATNIRLLIASPSTDYSNFKYYIGFGNLFE